MTSVTSTKKPPPGRSVSAQDLLTLRYTVVKNGLLRKKGKKLHIGKWPHRFVILTYDHIYVYANETAKVPNSKFCLTGYNQVIRCDVKGQNCCFLVCPAEPSEVFTVKTFACVSDADRKSWMAAIREQMFYANSMSKTEQTLTIGDDDEDYKWLEKPIFSPIGGVNATSIIRNDSNLDSEEDSETEKYEDLDTSSQGSDRSFNSNVSRSDKTKDDTLIFNEVASRVIKKGSSGSMEGGKVGVPQEPRPHRPVPQPPTEKEDIVNIGSEDLNNSNRPPRYSEVFNEEDHEDANLYVNNTAIRLTIDGHQPTLESLSTITDASLDRDQLILLLRAKQEFGTYLIRKSRHGDQKVIAVLSRGGDVKEYKILGSPTRLTLDLNTYFPCVEDLLRHYTETEALPKVSFFLKKGFYQK